MAPRSLAKLLKIKPVKRVTVDDVPDEPLPETVVYGTPVVTPIIPEPTYEERAAWAKARALQQTDENGQPAEGWATRIKTMMADGRLYNVNGCWHFRGREA